MMNFENLKTMSREQLLEVAGKQGVRVHHKAKPETIIKQIMDAVLVPQRPLSQTPEPSSPLVDPNECPRIAKLREQAERDKLNTPEMIEAALASIKAAQPKFESSYNREENTWTFKCLGAEESGNIFMPMRIILMKAGNVRRGKLALMGLNSEFDNTSAGGKNAYTNTVIAG